MPRLLLLLLIAYVFYRVMDYWVMPIVRQAFRNKPASPKGGGKGSSRESDKDWGGKYVDYEEVKEEEEK